MTDFTYAPDGRREYKSSSQRTLDWVDYHGPRRDIQFASPSVPPSPLDDASPYTTGSSDDDSSHSQPPHMVLRYPDGRDVHLSQSYQPAQSRHSGAGRASSHSRSRSGPTQLPRIVTNPPAQYNMSGDRISRSASQMGPIAPQQSRRSRGSFDAPPPHAMASSGLSSRPMRSQSAHPLSIRPQEDIRIRAPQSAGAQPSRNPIQSQGYPGRPSVVSPTPQRAFTPSNHTLLQAPHVVVSRSQPSIPLRNSPVPAPIAYSQSHPPTKHPRNMYAQPAHYASGGIGHGSNPTRNLQHSRARSGSATRSRIPNTSSRDSWSVIDEDEAWVNRRREPRSRHPQYPHRGDSSSISSESPPLVRSQTLSSSSTWYVPPSPGEKIKPLASEKSLYTATSTTKSPHSAYGPPSQWSGGSSGRSKHGFFSRFFGGKNDKKKLVPEPANRRLFRRHSTGGGLKRG